MHTGKKILLKIFIIIITVIAFSVTPEIYRFLITPPNHTFTFIHNNIPDYYYYLSLMRQGFDGHLLLTTRMTAEKFTPVFAQTFFALLGHLSRFSGINLIYMYLISRIISGVFLLFGSFLILKYIFKKQKEIVLGMILIGTSSGFWTLIKTGSNLSISQFLTFWTRFSVVLRATYLPHHQISTFFAVISILFLGKSLDQKNIRKLIIASAFGLLSGFAYFATMINIFGAVAIALILKSIITLSQSHSLSIYIKRYIYITIYIAISSLALIYLYLLSRSVFPWSTYEDISTKFTFTVPIIDYILSLGPVFIMTLVGIAKIIRQKSWLVYTLLGWAIFPFIGIYFLVKIYPAIGNAYYLEAANYIPLSILAVFGLNMLIEKLPKSIASYSLLALIVITYSLPPLYSSLKHEFTALSTNKYNIYIPNKVIESFAWLDRSTEEESIILAGSYFSSIIPAFTHNRSVAGHPANTFRSNDKYSDMYDFFSQRDSNQAQQILQNNNINYVYYSIDTAPPDTEFINSLDLERVYTNSLVNIYRVE